MLIVIIHWPNDLDRGMEVYGPFNDLDEQNKFVEECQEAASLGWQLLDNAHYTMTTMPKPFDPRSLMADGMKAQWPKECP